MVFILDVPKEILADIIKYVCGLQLNSVCKLLNNIMVNDEYGSLTYVLECIVPNVSFDRLPLMVIDKLSDNCNVIFESFSSKKTWSVYNYENCCYECGYNGLMGNRGVIVNQIKCSPIEFRAHEFIINSYY